MNVEFWIFFDFFLIFNFLYFIYFFYFFLVYFLFHFFLSEEPFINGSVLLSVMFWNITLFVWENLTSVSEWYIFVLKFQKRDFSQNSNVLVSGRNYRLQNFRLKLFLEAMIFNEQWSSEMHKDYKWLIMDHSHDSGLWIFDLKIFDLIFFWFFFFENLIIFFSFEIFIDFFFFFFGIFIDSFIFFILAC